MWVLLLVLLMVVCNGQRESKGVRKVAYIQYRSQTVAIEVCFPFNFAVVFDFINFRFRPSKQNQ
jgi:hypothetical protein